MPRNNARRNGLRPLALAGWLAFVVSLSPAETLDPAAWGEDHIGKDLPLYATGEECLFCHRQDIGNHLHKDPHAQTLRFVFEGESPATELAEALPEFAGEVGYAIGGEKAPMRFLRDGEEYNRLDLASVRAIVGEDDAGGRTIARFEGADAIEWDATRFADSCVGCHCTQVQPESRAYGGIALDCYSCHGDVSLTHTTDAKEILLSREREDPPERIASICGSCHLRGGRSKSAGTPYPHNFVPGDNLFRDYEVDFSDEHLASLNPGDRHIFENVRDIVLRGEGRTTCLTCHEVHRDDPKIHLGAPKGEICWTCHPRDDRSALIPYERRSATCEY